MSALNTDMRTGAGSMTGSGANAKAAIAGKVRAVEIPLPVREMSHKIRDAIHGRRDCRYALWTARELTMDFS